MGDCAWVFSRHGQVDALDLDEGFQKHLAERATYAKHEVTLSEALQVHANVPKYFINEGLHRAPVIMVGPTLDGRFLCVPIEPTNRIGVWRPVTAFEANAHHKKRYMEDQQ